MREYMSPK